MKFNHLLFIALLVTITSCNSVKRIVPDKNIEIYKKDFITADLSIYKNAIKKLTKKINKDNSNLEAYAGRAYCYGMTNQLSEALNDYNIVINKLPSVSRFLERSSINYRSRNYEKADKDLKKALELYEKNPQDSYSFGDFYNLGKKEYSVAIDYYKKAINEDKPNYKIPLDFNINYKIGYCYYNLNEYEKALKYYNIAKSIYSNSVNLYCDFAITYENLKSYDNAYKSFALAIEKDSEYIVPIYNRGNMSFDLGNYELAINDYIVSATLTTDLEIIQFINSNLSRLYYYNKDYEESISYANKLLVNKNDSEPDIFYCIAKYNMAACRLKQSKIHEAYKLYTECIQNGGLQQRPELYDDILYDIIGHYKQGKDVEIVKKVAYDLLELSEEEFQSKINEYQE